MPKIVKAESAKRLRGRVVTRTGVTKVIHTGAHVVLVVDAQKSGSPKKVKARAAVPKELRPATKSHGLKIVGGPAKAKTHQPIGSLIVAADPRPSSK